MSNDAKEIGPGMFVTENAGGGHTLHVDLPAVCRHLGMEPTPEAMLAAQRNIAEAIHEIIGGDVPMDMTTLPCPFQSNPKGAEDVDDNGEETEGPAQTGRRPAEG